MESSRRWNAARALPWVGFVLCALWLSLHGANAQAQACTQVTVLNHPSVQAFRTNGSTGSCVLPSGITMSWNHVGANRGLTSFGCSSYDPTYWMDGGTMTVTFSSPVNNVGFLMWGLDGTDSATVTVGNGTTQTPPQTLQKLFTDPCPGQGAGSPPNVIGNVVQGTGGGFFGQVGVEADNNTPYTSLQIAVTASGGGFGLVAVASSGSIGPPGPPSGPSGPTTIPTLSEWGMILLALLVGLTAFWRVRRKGA
jgi:hypothetical protein